MITHYIIHLIKYNLKLKASYRGGTFFRVERTSGKMNDIIMDKFGIIVPLKESEIEMYRNRYGKGITYTAIAKKKSLYTQFTDAWFSFYEEYKDIRPKYAAKDGKSLKAIINYLKKISGSEEEALELWQVILGSWKRLDDFHQKNTDLTYIEGQMNKIISNVKRIIKEGNGGVSDDYLKRVVDDLRS